VAIVPNGTRRLMKLQQYTSTDTGFGGNGIDQDIVLDDKQTDDGAQVGDGTGPSVDFEALQQQVNQDQPAESPTPESIQQALRPNEPGDNQLEESLEKAVISELTSLGVPEKMFNSKQGLDPFFQWDENLDDGTSSGFYLIPSFTQNQQVSRENAKELAQKIGSEFSLSQKITKEGHNFKVKFQTKVDQPQQAQFGTSFDSLLKPGSTEDLQAAATSRNPIITGSRDETLNILYNRFKGGK